MRIITISSNWLRKIAQRFILAVTPDSLWKSLLPLLIFANFSCKNNNTEPLKENSGENSSVEKINTNLGDGEYIISAYNNGLKEREFCDHAFKMITNQALKDFAEAMIKAHEVTNNELKDLASKNGVTLAEGLSEDSRKELFSNDDKSGPAFDKAFAEKAIADHKANIAVYEEGIKNARNEQVREFFRKRLPELSGHLQMAEKAEATINEKDYSLSK